MFALAESYFKPRITNTVGEGLNSNIATLQKQTAATRLRRRQRTSVRRRLTLASFRFQGDSLRNVRSACIITWVWLVRVVLRHGRH